MTRAGRQSVTWFTEPQLSYYERQLQALEDYKRALDTIQDPLLYTEGCAEIFKRETWLNGGYRSYLGIPTVGHVLKDMCTLYIGRVNLHYDLEHSKWANPFKIGPRDGDRHAVIEKYRQYILNTPELYDALGELQGHTLGCWCAPERCHGDVLIELYTYWASEQWRLYGFERFENGIGILGRKS